MSSLPAFETVNRVNLTGHVQSLRQLSLDHPGIVSVYLRVGDEFADARSISPRLRGLLEHARSMLDEGKVSAQNADELGRAIDTLLALRDEISSHAGRAAAMVESESLGHQTRLLLKAPVWDVGLVGRRAYIRPLVAAAETLRNVAVMVVESRSANLAFDVLTGESASQTIAGNYPRKANRGGWFALDERRNQQKAREERRRLIDRVGERLKEQDRRQEFDAIYVVGQEKITNEFVKRLSADLARRCFELVADTHTATRATILDQILDAEQCTIRFGAEALWEQVASEATPAREGVVGVRAVAAAANRGAVEKLLISGIQPIPGWECPSCWAVHLDDGQCASCEEHLVESFDVLDSITHRVLASGGSVSQLNPPIDAAEARAVAKLRY